jgi:hypothetical protein
MLSNIQDLEYEDIAFFVCLTGLSFVAEVWIFLTSGPTVLSGDIKGG